MTVVEAQRHSKKLINSAKINAGNTFRTMRRLMGIKQTQINEMFGISQGNLSKMEDGTYSIEKHLEKLRPLFNDWRKSKIKELEQEIQNLNEI